MKLMPLLALIGLLLIFGISEIFFSKILLGILSKPMVVLLLSVINFLVILFIIRIQPLKRQAEKTHGDLALSSNLESCLKTDQ